MVILYNRQKTEYRIVHDEWISIIWKCVHKLATESLQKFTLFY